MKFYDYLSGLLADVLSSLGFAAIVIMIAFAVALLAGWISWGELAGWLTLDYWGFFWYI